MTVGGMGFIPERLLMMMMMMTDERATNAIMDEYNSLKQFTVILLARARTPLPLACDAQRAHTSALFAFSFQPLPLPSLSVRTLQTGSHQ